MWHVLQTKDRTGRVSVRFLILVPTVPASASLRRGNDPRCIALGPQGWHGGGDGSSHPGEGVRGEARGVKGSGLRVLGFRVKGFRVKG